MARINRIDMEREDTKVKLLKGVMMVSAATGLWFAGFGGLAGLGVVGRAVRPKGMPVIVFKEADGDGFWFEVQAGTVRGVPGSGKVKVASVEHAFRFLDGLNEDEIHPVDRVYLATVVAFSRLPRGDRAHNTSGLPA